jgi:osmotically-inducible protein OsmY
MPRYEGSRHDWRDRDEPRRERYGARDREDFGQADYSRDYAYDPDTRAGYRAEERMRPQEDDYGQADYSEDWGYDRDRGAYRRAYEDREFDRDARYRGERERDEDRRDRREPRSWMDRAGDFFTGRAEGDRRVGRRRGPSDRVLWAVIVERLEDQRGLDLRDVEVLVEDGEVTLNGTVRRKEDKRRIEDIADIDGVRHVQNNLRARDRGHWTFL